MRPDAWLSRMRKHLALAACVATVSAILVPAELGHRELMRRHQAAMDSIAAGAALHALAVRLADAETGQRGYLLTSRREHLAPAEEAIPAIHGLIERLRPHYARHVDAEAARIFTTLIAAIGAKLGELELTVELHERGRPERAIEIFESAIGKHGLVQVGALIEDLVKREEADAGAFAYRWRDALDVLRTGIVLLAVLDVLLVAALFLRLRHERRLEGEARRVAERRGRRLESLVSRLQEAAEAERASLAHELHDELGALLAVANMDIEWVRRHLGAESAVLHAKLGNVVHLLDQCLVSKSRIVEGLRPSALETFGLSTAARLCASQFAERTGWSLALDLPDHDPDLPETVEIALFRVLQESLTNAARHAGASDVRISLVAESNYCRLEVEDNGRGFRRRDVRPSAHGLFGMRQRIAARHGTLTIRSALGEGTTVCAMLPLTARDERACLSPWDDSAIYAVGEIARA